MGGLYSRHSLAPSFQHPIFLPCSRSPSPSPSPFTPATQATKVHPIPLKFRSKEGQNSTLRVIKCVTFETTLEVSNMPRNEKTSPLYPTAGLPVHFDVTDKQPGC